MNLYRCNVCDTYSGYEPGLERPVERCSDPDCGSKSLGRVSFEVALLNKLDAILRGLVRIEEGQ